MGGPGMLTHKKHLSFNKTEFNDYIIVPENDPFQYENAFLPERRNGRKIRRTLLERRNTSFLGRLTENKITERIKSLCFKKSLEDLNSSKTDLKNCFTDFNSTHFDIDKVHNGEQNNKKQFNCSKLEIDSKTCNYDEFKDSWFRDLGFEDCSSKDLDNRSTLNFPDFSKPFQS
ncbi:hypothetical protein BB559_004115, partial [Furculomyces boomerangus]